MKRKTLLSTLLLCLLIPALAFGAYKFLPSRTGAEDIGSSARRWLNIYGTYLSLTGYAELPEISAPASPAANSGRIYVKDSTGTTVLAFKDSAGTETILGAAGAKNTLDQSYDQGGVGAGRTINATDGAVIIQSTDADTTNILEINKSPSGGAAGAGVSVTMGANATGAGISFANSGSGNDLLGSGGLWSITKAGLGTFPALNGVTTLNGTSGNLAIGAGTNTLAIDTSSWDISSSGAMSGFSTLSLTDDISLANGKAVKSSTTTAQTMKLQGYDVDNTTYRDVLTITNGNTVAAAIGSGVETVAVNSTTWDVSTAGVFSGVTGVTFAAGAAAGISLASDGATDDLTIEVTGATDSSLVLQSAGTGEDAVRINASAGGIDIDALAAKDINIAGGQVALVSKDDAASAISLTANIGTSETIVLTNTQGTSESALTLVATAGGVNVDAAAAKDLDLAGGRVKLVSKDNAAGAISLTANVGTTETITVTNTQGTAAGAIALTATAGGLDLDAAAAKDVDISGGQVLLSSKDNAASAIALTANVGTSETIVVTNTQGTDAAAIALTATAGGITATVADTKAITLNGTANLKVGSNVASPAGGELDLGAGNYFYITGTNNITSIAAADSTAGRMIILRFADVLTFTDGGNLKIAGNLGTTADDTISLICDGTNWYEVARSVN